MSGTITPGLVSLDVELGDDKESVLRSLAARVVVEGRASDSERLFADAWEREAKDDTGLLGGIAIPHAKSGAVSATSLAFARLSPGVDFGAPDGPADLVFFIAAPDADADEHLTVLSRLARNLMRDRFISGLRSARTPEEVVSIVDAAISAETTSTGPVAHAAAPPTAPSPTAGRASDERLTVDGWRPRIVAVTSCATGIANAFMAAESLRVHAARSGVDLVVEPQGSSDYHTIPQRVIDRADAVIFANDVDVRDEPRFAGKPVVRANVKRGIEDAAELIAAAVAAARSH